MHWAAHGNTAAEVIFNRIDADKPYLGLTSFKGPQPTKDDIRIAKNYLNEEELNILNWMVTTYLEVAELQALNRRAMYMQDWVERLDDLLRNTGNNILPNAGSISHEQALLKADQEHLAYKEKTKDEITRVKKDFVAYIDQTGKAIEQKEKKNQWKLIILSKNQYFITLFITHPIRKQKEWINTIYWLLGITI